VAGEEDALALPGKCGVGHGDRITA
jgi:hypothetical protein